MKTRAAKIETKITCYKALKIPFKLLLAMLSILFTILQAIPAIIQGIVVLYRAMFRDDTSFIHDILFLYDNKFSLIALPISPLVSFVFSMLFFFFCVKKIISYRDVIETLEESLSPPCFYDYEHEWNYETPKSRAIKQARSSDTPVKTLVLLPRDGDTEIQQGLAGNPNTPVDILRELSTDRNLDVLRSLALNMNTPVDILRKLSTILRKLSTNNFWQIRSSVAGNPNTPVDILRELSTDRDLDVLRSLALNPNKPVDILRKISMNNFWQIRNGVAGNPNTPVDILRELSTDNSLDVLCSLALNMNTPVDILRKLSIYDEDKYGRKDEDEYSRYNYKVRFSVTRNPNTPDDILSILVEDTNIIVRNSAKEEQKRRAGK